MANRAIHRESRGGVIGVCGRLEIRQVTGAAIGGQAREFSIYVTLGALHGVVRAGERERRLAVIEHRAGPRRRGVAKRASGGEAGRGVFRIRGSVEFLHVA